MDDIASMSNRILDWCAIWMWHTDTVEIQMLTDMEQQYQAFSTVGKTFKKATG